MALLEDGSAASLLPFVSDHVAPAATVITDAWMGYHGLAKLGYAHRRRSQRAARARGEDPATLLPAVHRVASLAKRWLLSTHQGAVEPAHLQSYLDEFVFRFNRRRSRSRGMVFYRVLELAAGHEPVRYRNITAGNKQVRSLAAKVAIVTAGCEAHGPEGQGHRITPPNRYRPSRRSRAGLGCRGLAGGAARRRGDGRDCAGAAVKDLRASEDAQDKSRVRRRVPAGHPDAREQVTHPRAWRVEEPDEFL